MSRSILRDTAWPWLLGLAALTVIVYVPALHNALLSFDDNYLITENWAVAHFSLPAIAHIFTSYDPELYDPLAMFGYQLMHLMFGFNPAAYHALSLLLHLLSTLLVYRIIVQLSQRRPIAIVTAALFALHPMQVEAVLWASALKDVLSAFFFLSSVAAYLKFRSTPLPHPYPWREGTYWLSIVFFLFGLLSKVSIAPLPFVLLLIDYAQRRPFDRRVLIEKLPHVFLSGVFIVVALSGKSHAFSVVGPFASVLLLCKSIAFSFAKVLWPLHLSVLYPQTGIPSLASSEFFVPVFLVLLFSILAVVLRNRLRILSVATLLYFLMFVPTIGTFYKNGFLLFASDRYAYLPSIAVFALVAMLTDALWQRCTVSRPFLITIGILACSTLTFLAQRQTTYWRDTATLFRHVLDVYPQSAMAHNNLGAELGATPQGLAEFQKAVELDPTYIVAIHNIAAYYLKTGDRQRMEQTYERGIALIEAAPHVNRDELQIFNEYADFLDQHGETSRAITLLQQAVSFDPNFAQSHYNLGVKYQQLGRTDDAIAEFERAVALEGDQPDFLYHLAAVDGEKGRLREAATLLQTLLTIDPAYPNAQRHLDDMQRLMAE